MLKIASVHPGELLKDELDARGLSQAAFAKHIHVSPAYLNDIVKGRRGISAEMASKFGRALGTSAELWCTLQVTYDLSKVRPDAHKHIKKIAA